MMNRIYTGLVALTGILLFHCCSCSTPKKAASKQGKIEKSVCEADWISYPNQPHPLFHELQGSVSNAPKGVTLPHKYARYSVNPDTLTALFAYLRNNGGKGMIMIPIEKQCEAFELQTSGAMAPGLRDKYPDIVSLQGSGINNRTAAIRLDWNGKEMRAQITYNAATYYIMPLTDNNIVTYLVYNREETGEVKQPFETAPANNSTNKVYYDR